MPEVKRAEPTPDERDGKSHFRCICERIHW